MVSLGMVFIKHKANLFQLNMSTRFKHGQRNNTFFINICDKQITAPQFSSEPSADPKLFSVLYTDLAKQQQKPRANNLESK